MSNLSESTRQLIMSMVQEQFPSREQVPTQAKTFLGQVQHKGGATNVYVIHSADAIITDGENIVVISRSQQPYKGKLALPGGWMDPTNKAGDIEDITVAAAREAKEEVNVTVSPSQGRPVGQRLYAREHDIREAHKDLETFAIAKGELFVVTGQAVLFEVPDTNKLPLKAGDDAAKGSAKLIKVSEINPNTFGVPDHGLMVEQAMEMLTASKAPSGMGVMGSNLSKIDIVPSGKGQKEQNAK